MEWSKIPTNLINGKFEDAEILAIVKYQLLYALYEEQPNEKILSRFLTKKQKNIVKNFVSVIQPNVEKEIASVQKKRQTDKLYYAENKGKCQNSDNLSDNLSDNGQSEQIRQDKIREDNIRKEKKRKEENNAKIDYYNSPLIEKIFEIYKVHCGNLVPLDRFCRKNIDLKKMIGSYLEQTECDLEYFTRVCDIANGIQKIGSVNVDLKTILRNYDGFYNGKYTIEDKCPVRVNDGLF